MKLFKAILVFRKKTVLRVVNRVMPHRCKGCQNFLSPIVFPSGCRKNFGEIDFRTYISIQVYLNNYFHSHIDLFTRFPTKYRWQKGYSIFHPECEFYHNVFSHQYAFVLSPTANKSQRPGFHIAGPTATAHFHS